MLKRCNAICDSVAGKVPVGSRTSPTLRIARAHVLRTKPLVLKTCAGGNLRASVSTLLKFDVSNQAIQEPTSRWSRCSGELTTPGIAAVCTALARRNARLAPQCLLTSPHTASKRAWEVPDRTKGERSEERTDDVAVF